MEILIRNGILITMDENRTIYRDGAVAIDDGKILEVGKTNSLKNKYKPEFEVDAKGKAVLPGLVNAHGHFWQVLSRGLGDDRSLLDWAHGVQVPFAMNTREDEFYSGALLACVEMLKSGTTCCVDDVDFMPMSYAEQSAKAIEKTGIRGIAAPSVLDGEYPEELFVDTEKAVKEYSRIIKAWHKKADERVHIWLAPLSPGISSTELFKESRRLADEYDTGITTHVAEVPERVDLVKKMYGSDGVVAYLDEIGVLGPHLLCAHSIWVTRREIQLLKATNSNVVHNIGANLICASGVAPIPHMIRTGVTVALGTDGAASNNNLDMFQEAYLAATVHKVNELNVNAISARKVLELATIGGATALGLEKEIGSIESGKRADIILMDLRKPHLVPLHKITSNLVYCASGADVDTVIANGKIVMEEREVRTVNETEIIEAAQEAASNIVERAGLQRFVEM